MEQKMETRNLILLVKAQVKFHKAILKRIKATAHEQKAFAKVRRLETAVFEQIQPDYNYQWEN